MDNSLQFRTAREIYLKLSCIFHMIQSNKNEWQVSDRSMPKTMTFETPPDIHYRGLSALIAARHNVSPKRLEEPAPSIYQLDEIFMAAAAAPDHGKIGAWRYIIVPEERRSDLAEAFSQALLERDSSATSEQIQTAREKAYRAPFIFLVVVSTACPGLGISVFERLISVGAGIQNSLLVAHSMGYGCGLTSGRSINSSKIAKLFGLGHEEIPICFVNIGTVVRLKPSGNRRTPKEFVSSL